LWDVLETLTTLPNAKVFTFSGTPGRTRAEMLLQLELVRNGNSRVDHALLCGDSGDSGEPGDDADWQARLADYADGLVSYVVRLQILQQTHHTG
jgi:hypothetical protein